MTKLQPTEIEEIYKSENAAEILALVTEKLGAGYYRIWISKNFGGNGYKITCATAIDTIPAEIEEVA